MGDYESNNHAICLMTQLFEIVEQIKTFLIAFAQERINRMERDYILVTEQRLGVRSFYKAVTAL